MKLMKNIIILFSPAIPHFASDCLNDLGYEESVKWPTLDKKLLQEEKVDYVVQINGKKRGVIEAKRDTLEKELILMINKNENLKKYLFEKEIKKKIFVPNKLINIIV